MKQFLLQKLFSIYRAIFARRCFARWNRLLFQLSLRGLGVLNYGDKISGEEHFLRRFAKRGGTLVVLDVGANEGQYARALKAHAPQSIVYAFEPHPRTFERLQEQAQRHSFTALNLACGSKPDRLTLYDYQDHPEGSQHASLHQGVIEQIHRGVAKSWEVQVTTVDEFLRQGHIQKVNLLKVDTEGHEYEVLIFISF